MAVKSVWSDALNFELLVVVLLLMLYSPKSTQQPPAQHERERGELLRKSHIQILTTREERSLPLNMSQEMRRENAMLVMRVHSQLC